MFVSVTRWRYLEGAKVESFLEPAGVEIEAQGGSIRVEMTFKIMHEHVICLVLRTVRWARVHHRARIFLNKELTNFELDEYKLCKFDKLEF
jgi:hypothetical protein